MINWSTLFDITVSGIGLGSLYALVAMGFSLIYKVTGVLNFAQGQLALVGAYAVIFFAGVMGLHPLLAVAATILLGVLMGVLLERVVFRFFIGEPILSIIIVTLALGGIFQGLVQLVIGPLFKAYPPLLRPDWSLSLPFGASISAAFALGVALSLVVVTGMLIFFRYTVIGSILRASATDQQAAIAMGVSVKRSIVIAWTLSIAITAVGGILLAMSRGGAGFAIQTVGVIILAAVVFGGLDSVGGAFLGSLIVGILEQYGSFYFEPMVGPGFGEIFPILFLLLVILFKPYGLFGTERIERL